MIWSCDTAGQRVPCFDSCQLTWTSNAVKLMWTLMFTNPAWLRSPCLCDAATTAIGDNTCPQAIVQVMWTMKKETLGFHNFFTWLSSDSPISVGMGLHSPALRPAKLHYYCCLIPPPPPLPPVQPRQPLHLICLKIWRIWYTPTSRCYTFRSDWILLQCLIIPSKWIPFPWKS